LDCPATTATASRCAGAFVGRAFSKRHSFGVGALGRCHAGAPTGDCGDGGPERDASAI